MGYINLLIYICKSNIPKLFITMVNSEQFAARLQNIMEYYDLSAASFAEAIEVGRSSISHILSGRNKPSLDFVLKVVQTFPEVELYWLLNGKGNFPSGGINKEPAKQESPKVPESESTTPSEKRTSTAFSFQNSSDLKKIRKIVIFYEDGSFEAYQN